MNVLQLLPKCNLKQSTRKYFSLQAKMYRNRDVKLWVGDTCLPSQHHLYVAYECIENSIDANTVKSIDNRFQ